MEQRGLGFGQCGDAGGPLEGRLVGQVCHLDDTNGYGFVRNAELRKAYDKDAFVPRSHLEGLQVGSCISFRVSLNSDGNLQAVEVELAPEEALEARDAVGRRWEGHIAAVLPDKGCGFIRSAELRDTFGTDVYVGRAQLGNLGEGDTVAFTAYLSREGQPQAKDLVFIHGRGSGSSGGAPGGGGRERRPPLAEIPGLTDQRFVGWIRHFHFDMYFGSPLFGFLRCPELHAAFGADAYAAAPELDGMQEGDGVSFNVVVGRAGQLQSRNVRLEPGHKEADAADAAPTELGDFSGQVEAIDWARRMGFVSCPELQELSGRSALFLCGNHLEDVSEGEPVTFSARLHAHGLLQATNITACTGAQALPPAAAARRRRTLEALAAAAEGFLFEFSAQQLANLAWSLAALECTAPPLRDSIASAAKATIPEFEPPALASMLWSVAILPVKDPPLLQAISSAARSRITQLSSQALAPSAWSIALLEFTDQPLLDALAAAANSKLTQYRSEELSRTAWSYAFIKCANYPLRDAISAAARRRISDGASTQCLANMAWADAGLAYVHQPLLDAISAAALRRITSFRPPELAGPAWAVAILGYADPPLRNAIAAAALPRISVMPRDRIANMAWAYATRGFVHAPLMESISAASLPKIREYRPMENGSLARSLWILASDSFHSAWDVDALQELLRLPSNWGPKGSISGRGELAGQPTGDAERAGWIDEEELAERGYALWTTGNPGDGKTRPKQGDRVCLAYTGMLASTGSVFDTCERFEFTVGSGAVISGWELGILEMSVGQEARLAIHHLYAYGEGGAPAAEPVPPFANLLYDMTLLEVRPPEAEDVEMPELSLPSGSGPCPPSDAATSPGGPEEGPGCTGGKLAEVLRAAGGLSFEAWLSETDASGGLLRYEAALAGSFDSLGQVLQTYAEEGPGGTARLRPEFFEDFGVRAPSHRRAFDQWFTGRAAG